MMDFNQIYEETLQRVEARLDEAMPLTADLVSEAARYSLLAGGKRIRPVILLAVNRAAGGEEAKAMPFAAAIEMIHSYSLVHDDLPAMDNDDLRRGKPTNHVVYGEGIAILAGDALLNRAYEVMLEAVAEGIPGAADAAGALAAGAGYEGMIGGQSMDMVAELRPELLSGLSETDLADYLKRLQYLKTGGLIRGAILAGYYLGTANAGRSVDPEHVALWQRFADKVGLAFQMRDDLLDVESDSETMGKTVGKDERDSKLTFVTLFGVAETKRKYEALCEEIRALLTELGESFAVDGFLTKFTDFLLTRTH